jgi:hypothetical protein
MESLLLPGSVSGAGKAVAPVSAREGAIVWSARMSKRREG